MRSLEQVNIRTNVRTYVLTYIRTGQTLYPLHNFVVRGDNDRSNDYFIPVSDNTSDKTFRTAPPTIVKELNTPLHHPQHQLINTYVSASVNIRPGNKKSP